VAAGGVPAARRGWRGLAAVGALGLAGVIATLAIVGVFDGSGGGSSAETAGEPSGVSAPAARADATVHVEGDPVAGAVGGLNIRTASAAGHSVSAIVPATSDHARPPIPVDGTPASVVVGFESVWVVDRAGNSLLRLDPGQGTAPIRIPVGAGPSDVAASA